MRFDALTFVVRLIVVARITVLALVLYLVPHLEPLQPGQMRRTRQGIQPLLSGLLA